MDSFRLNSAKKIVKSPFKKAKKMRKLTRKCRKCFGKLSKGRYFNCESCLPYLKLVDETFIYY